MRREERAAFVAGILAGLGLGGVVLLTGVAARRTWRARHREHMRYLDREPDERERELFFTELGNAPDPPRLASELPDFSPSSQRW